MIINNKIIIIINTKRKKGINNIFGIKQHKRFQIIIDRIKHR